MDTARARDDYERDGGDQGGGVGEPMFAIGTDERRMHVRAYNHWVSLLGDRPYPAIADLDPGSIADFGPNSVLLDFTDGIENPAIRFIGRALREECAVDASIERIAEVPSRSLLSRLTDHYLQIIANRAPIGFEAEFTGTRGNTMMYRGILMPFSSNGETIDFIYGVISWKEMVSPAQQASLDAELARALRAEPASSGAWADGPSGSEAECDSAGGSLADKLAHAREGAAAARAAATRSHAALYRALGRAHDFRVASEHEGETLAALLADAGIVAQPRAPMTAVAKLIFGADYDKTRLTEFAAVLAYAHERAVPAGGLVALLEAHGGGIKGIVAAARAARRPRSPARAATPSLGERPALARVELATGIAAGEAVVLVGRVTADGGIDVVAALADARLADRALARVA